MTPRASGAAATTGAGARRRPPFALTPWLCILPSLVLVASTLLVPLCLGVAQAFRTSSAEDPFSEGTGAGFGNVLALLGDPALPTVVANTVVWTIVCLLVQSSLGLVMALALNGEARILAYLRPVLFLPWAIPSILVGLFWKVLITPGTSFLPGLLCRLGLLDQPSDLLAKPADALWGPILAYIWIGIPFFAITSLAALQTIPRDLHEAMELDGASAWERFRSITLPLIAPTLLIAVLLRTVWIANFGDLVWIMTQGGPAGASQIVPTFIYTTAFVDLDDGRAAAMALVQVCVLTLYACVILRLRSRLTRGRP